MIENGLYIINEQYFEKFEKLGCAFKDRKEANRPVFCCIKDLKYPDLYWAIPLSEITEEKTKNGTVKRVQKYMSFKEGSLGWAFYHIGKTTKAAIFNISSAFPVTKNHVDREWTLEGKHFVVPYTSNVGIIKKKLRRILSEEKRFPNKFEQKITLIKNTLLSELQTDLAKQEAAGAEDE